MFLCDRCALSTCYFIKVLMFMLKTKVAWSLFTMHVRMDTLRYAFSRNHFFPTN